MWGQKELVNQTADQAISKGKEYYEEITSYNGITGKAEDEGISFETNRTHEELINSLVSLYILILKPTAPRI